MKMSKKNNNTNLFKDFLYNVVTPALFRTPRTDNFFSIVMNTPIGGFCDLNGRNYAYMLNLMNLNNLIHDERLEYIGDDAFFNGDSSKVSNLAKSYSYSEDSNYLVNFVDKKGTSEVGQTKIFTTDENRRPVNYTNHNQLYETTENLYPDDNDTGTFSNKWEKDTNKNSILYKTKKLFMQHKINTIISRFHTDTNENGLPDDVSDARSQYGLSHGRNLLTKDAENGNSYNTNGYNNPYCRVWTHHYQYDRLDKLIRPFARKDANGNTEITKIKDFHIWPNFKLNEGDKKYTDWGWKDETNKGWEKTVLGDNGFPKITPLYGGGGKSNRHTKDCMFSIENLAWQGYDPYSFEKALSWEQRGPMGGRIMWFPPYGISFNETTSVNWNSNTFIGRGEDVYTYTNTVRQGTLNFMLVVDHPSIIDYVSWDDDNHSKGSDTDLLRFFAGCDGGQNNEIEKFTNEKGEEDSIFRKKEVYEKTVYNKDINYNVDIYKTANNSLIDAANPTPLTDEYLQVSNTESIAVTENEKPQPKPIPQEPTIPDTEPRKVEFYVFYPNNYSGYYDKPGSTVEAMAYLLAGVGAQKETDPNNPNHPKDIDLKFDELYRMDGIEGTKGYEMLGSGLSNDSENEINYIVGTTPNWRYAPNRKSYVDAKNKKWYYRIDGLYEIAPKGQWNINTYDQTLLNTENYRDTNCYGLNADCSVVKDKFSNEKDNEDLFSFAEIALALCKNEKNIEKLEANSGLSIEDDRIKNLIDLFSTAKITKISSVGYSNSHGNNTKSVNAERNNNLAKQRATSVVDWLTKSCGLQTDNTEIDTSKYDSSVQVQLKDEKNVSGESAKMFRSARITIEMEVNQTVTVSETEQSFVDEEGVKNVEYTRFTGFTEHSDGQGGVYYTNDNETDPSKKGRKWFYDENTKEMKYIDPNDGVYDRSNYGKFRENKGSNGINGTKSGEDSYNKVRYDQEYHFFKELQSSSPTVFDSLMEKIKYFDPAFHSMTPEGFNARLTFLNQCTRQGNTVGSSDLNGRSANNLAFGRPPYCVLRLGDFYNQMIVIDNINISYDPLVWDMNTEGAGMQPLIANVSLSFKFIGGGDMGGAVKRLQNAMSFNYYANASLYDNRADRVEYNFDWKEGGAIDHSLKNSYFYNTQMNKK